MKKFIPAFLLYFLSTAVFGQLGQLNPDSLIQTLKTMKDDTNKVNRLNVIGQQLMNMDPTKSFTYAQEALNLAQKLEYKPGIMTAQSLIGLNQLMMGKFPEAESYLQKSLAIAEELHHLEGLAIGYSLIGNLNYAQSKFPQAIDLWVKGLKVSEERHDTINMVGTLSNIGSVYMDMHNDDKALEYFNKAIALNLKTTSLLNRGEIYGNIGSIYDRKKNYPRAIYYFNEALKVAEITHDADMLSRDYISLGLSYRKQNKCDTAYGFAMKALTIQRELQNPSELAYTYLILGQCYADFVAKNRMDLLTKYVGGNRQQCLSIALAYHDSSLSIFEQLQIPARIATAYESKSELLATMGRYAEAYTLYKRSNEIQDSLFNIELDNQVAQTTLNYEFEKKEAAAKAEQEKKDIQNRNIRNSIIAVLAGALVFLVVVYRQRNKINKARERSDELLLNILPEEVANELKAKGESEAKLIDEVTVLFTDFKGFTAISEQMTPKELVQDLHECFTAFDHIMHKHGLEKIKTIGDAYMAAGGLPVPNSTHAGDAVKAALEIIAFMEAGKAKKQAMNQPYFEVRVGVHTGPVVAGIVGVKKFSYDIWGDTVNTASRMESSGEVGKVNISGTTYALVKDQFTCIHRGQVSAKGKGEVDMYFVEG